MRDPTLEHQLWLLLGAGVLPLWLLAGLCDYVVHVRSRIVETSGLPESSLHLLQTVEIGVPMLAILVLDVNALVLLVASAGVIAHCITAYADLRCAAQLREVGAFEQYVHAFLIALPIVALALVMILHWPAFAALWQGSASWGLQWKQPPWDAAVVAAVLTASLLTGVLPGLYEFVRAWQWSWEHD